MINPMMLENPLEAALSQQPQAQASFPDPEVMLQLLNSLPPDPSTPKKDRPSKEVLLERKRRIMRFWRPRNLRMVDDQKFYQLEYEVEEVPGQQEIGASETLILNDPYILVEKISNMVSATEAVINVVPKDPGMKEVAQKVEDMLYWWREEASSAWSNNLNGDLTRDEIIYLSLRGWLTGRIMLNPDDAQFPWRYDLIDPLHVYPQKGDKELRWVFHVYKDSKINVLNDMGWDSALLDRIEESLKKVGDEADIEIASYFDDVWHVLFLNDEEVWSAPHNYGFVPWIIVYSFGPPYRRTDPQYGHSTKNTSTDITNTGFGTSRATSFNNDYVKWWGVSVFQGIKDVYTKINKLASAIMTEAMKAPNPPIVIYTNQAGEAEAKSIDTSIGATNYLVMNQEDYKVVNYGFKPTEIMPLLQLLSDARNRGALPSVMYGEGANFLSGFAVSLLTNGARDLLFPLLKAHQNYLMNLNRAILRLTAEVYPLPIQMIGKDPQTGARSQMTSISAEEINMVGYANRVFYRNVLPQDKMANAQMADMLTKSKLISMDTARGEEYIGLRNPFLENDKVLGDMAYFNPEVVKAAIPYALLKTNPMLYIINQQAQMVEQQKEMLAMMMSGKFPLPSRPGESKGEAASSASPPPAMQNVMDLFNPPPGASEQAVGGQEFRG